MVNISKSRKSKARTKLVVFLLLLILALILLYVFLSFSNYTKCPISRNLTYTLDDRNYTVPDLPIYGTGYLLEHSFRKSQRELLIAVFKIAKLANISIWLSGGTLLGFIRNGNIMPWDDDIDVHTSFENLYFLFSSEFQNICNRLNCEAIRLKFLSHINTTRIAAGVRIRFKKTKMPCCDIFFTNIIDNKVKKIDGWSSQQITYNKKEQFDKKDIYPLRKTRIDDLDVVIPQNPVNILKKQYGDSVMDKIYITSPFMSHAVPFSFEYAWTKTDSHYNI